ncbi:ArsR family transcriptional regulator [uncultured Thermanaerothrix sp.]|uniref:helix-turn-helix transcriptional regulator n=1 Tax=uncultured Thermanaerothrix sp. TaxID=1195149 RepID=UPI0026080031|nr:ArsR family transcriptional regulator [uncultured Thermanaerothrix sp.]
MNLKSTRERILQTLLNSPRRTINELAQAAGISPISVRHHLNALLAEGLVTSEEERHGVGRPRLVYYLTEAGLERFPTRYVRLTTRLLDQLKGTLSPETISEIFAQIGEEIATNYHDVVAKMSTEERLEFLREVLAEEGFLVEWEKEGDTYRIREINCPYYYLSQQYPEVCSVDQRLISTLLAYPADKVTCVVQKDQRCVYIIRMENEHGKPTPTRHESPRMGR